MSIVRCPHCNEEIRLSAVGKGAAMRTFDHDQAIGLLRMGATRTEVANAFGVSTARISTLAKIHGLPSARGKVKG